jgi:hypothetical protein
MQEIKSHAGKWPLSLCSCSRDTVHFHHGKIVLDISREDLGELGLTMQSVAENAASTEWSDHLALKKGLVH